MLPQTIDEIIAELERIIELCTKDNNRIGYFAALYHKVTCRVREGIAKGEFIDAARMELLDVSFANRYIEAWQQYENGVKPTSSWRIAFDAAKSSRTLVLQHLLLGMNAHINLDLGIATAITSGRRPLSDIKSDFNAINGILAMLTSDIMNQLRRVSPILSLMGLHATRYNSILVQFSISNARDGAWCFAEELSDTTDDTNAIAARDAAISELANGLTHATGLMRLTLWVIHLFEWKRPSKIINVLYEGRPAVVKSGKVEH